MFKKIAKKINENTIIFLFKKMWKFAGKQKKNIVIFIFLATVSQFIMLVPPLVFKKFLDEIQINGFGQHNIQYLLFILSWLFFISLVFWAFHGPSRILQRKVAFHVINNYREYLLKKTLNLNISWHGERDSGDSIDKINKSSNGIFKFSLKFYKIIGMVIKVIGTTIALMYFNFYVGIFAIVLLIIALLITTWFDGKLFIQHRKLNLLYNRISAKMFDVLSNITSIKILGIEEVSFLGIKKSFWNPFPLYYKNAKLVELKWFIGQTFFTLITVVPIIFYLIFIHKNNLLIEIGTLSAMYLYLTNLRTVYFAFAGISEEMMIQKAQVLNAQEIENILINQGGEKEIQYNKLWKNIFIKNLIFKYRDSGKKEANHLSIVKLSIKRGEKIACIGESGSGKTTFLKVIHGLYNTASAKISFDNLHFSKTSFSNINLQTTLVPQEPELFSSSIRENVTFALDYSDAQVQKVLELAEFSEVLDVLPEGLDSVVNEKGVNLSGGQKQRLALARALLFSENKEIVLLDESTSSVGSTSEVKIYQNIFSEFSGKTFIASIHKMNLLKYFDRILIFEKGNIIDEGGFDDLYSRNRKFASQWNEYIKLH